MLTTSVLVHDASRILVDEDFGASVRIFPEYDPEKSWPAQPSVDIHFAGPEQVTKLCDALLVYLKLLARRYPEIAEKVEEGEAWPPMT